MSGFKVTPAQLEALGATVHRANSDIRSAQHGLRTQLVPLFGADWSGTASAQFTALYADFDLHARGLADALDGIGAMLVRAGAAYAETEALVASTFR